MITTKGRYGLRLMVDLAQQKPGAFIPLKDVAERQEISEKYLEAIVRALMGAGLLEGRRGRTGGYRLVKSPAEYTAAEILEAAEGSLAPVACLRNTQTPCAREGECKTLPVWRGFEKTIRDYFSTISLNELADGTFKEPACSEG